MSFVRHTLTIAGKDLRSELRGKEALNAALSFALVILLLFSFTIESSPELTREASGGMLWITFAFAGALILNRSFARELPNDCLDALVAAPLSAAALFTGKALANLVLLSAIQLVCFPVFVVFYNLTSGVQFGPLLVIAVLGAWGITVIGTMFSALTVNVRLREVMLPLLVNTTLLPALLAAMQSTVLVLAGEPLFTGEALVWLKFLIGFDVIFTSLAVALVDTVLVG